MDSSSQKVPTTVWSENGYKPGLDYRCLSITSLRLLFCCTYTRLLNVDYEFHHLLAQRCPPPLHCFQTSYEAKTLSIHLINKLEVFVVIALVSAELVELQVSYNVYK